MRVKVLLQITAEDGNAAAAEVAVFEKQTERPEDLGLSIVEGKALMAAVTATGRRRSARVMGGAASLLRGVWRPPA